ncbi:MAG: KEOPS complex subunit Cgi121 [Candidatus Bathyarchaeia archaeon]
MLKYLTNFGVYMEITGFRNCKIGAAEDFLKITHMKPHRVTVQFFDAETVATWQHLYFAVVNALTAFKNKTTISENIAVEILLYASAQRQIRKAIKQMGIKHESENIAAVIVGENPDDVKTALLAVANHVNAEPDESVLALSAAKMKRIMEAFGISELELEAVAKDDVQQALVDLVIERVALLATQI